MLFLGEGKHHQVYLQDDEYVVKIPQKDTNISYDQAVKSARFFQEEFSEYVPETAVLPGDKEIPYRVIQKRVNGVLLGDFLRTEGMCPKIRESLSFFTKKALQILDRKCIGFDIIGSPSEAVFKGKWEGCTNMIVNPTDRSISFIDCIVPSRLDSNIKRN